MSRPVMVCATNTDHRQAIVECCLGRNKKRRSVCTWSV